MNSCSLSSKFCIHAYNIACVGCVATGVVKNNEISRKAKIKIKLVSFPYYVSFGAPFNYIIHVSNY